MKELEFSIEERASVVPEDVLEYLVDEYNEARE